MARSKSSVNPNKVEGTGANAGQYIREQYKNEYAAMAGDKGSRGIASADFEKKDTVQYNRDVNGGVARDKDGRKIARANRNRPPEDQAVGRLVGASEAGTNKDYESREEQTRKTCLAAFVSSLPLARLTLPPPLDPFMPAYWHDVGQHLGSSS